MLPDGHQLSTDHTVEGKVFPVQLKLLSLNWVWHPGSAVSLKSAVGTSVSNFQAMLMVRIWVQVVYVGSNPRKYREGPSTGREVRKGALMGVTHQRPWAMGLSL